MTSFIGLPPVPTELKPVIPFIQRADELKKQDPIISYWCKLGSLLSWSRTDEILRRLLRCATGDWNQVPRYCLPGLSLRVARDAGDDEKGHWPE